MTAVLSAVSAVSASAQFTEPTFGGTVWTYDVSQSTFTKADGTTSNTPARENGKGPELVLDNVGTVTANAGADTSDSGGIKVTGNSTVTSSLGGWAGSIYVGDGSVLNAGFAAQLKNTEGTDVANVWVDGTLTFTSAGWSSNAINIADGNSSQNWHIGENGLINFGVANIVTGGRTLNLEVIMGNDSATTSTLTNRTITTYSRGKIATITAGGDLYHALNSNRVFYNANGDQLKGFLTLSADGTTIGVSAVSADDVKMLYTNETVAWTANGTADETLFYDESGVKTSFVNGDSVMLTDGANVTAMTDVWVDTLTLYGGSLAMNGHTVGTSTLVLSGTTTAPVQLDFSASGSRLFFDTLSVTDNSALNLEGSWEIGTLTTEAYTFTKGGEGTLTLTSTGNLNGGVLNITEGTVEVKRGSVAAGVLQNTTVNVSAGATFKSSGHDALGWGAGHTNKIVLNGAEGDYATFLNNEDGEGSNTLMTDIEMNGYAKVTGTKINTFGGTITASGTNNVIESDLLIRENVTFTVNSGGELELSGKIGDYGQGFTGTVTVAGGGTLNVSGSNNTYSRAWNVNGGTLQLSGNGMVAGTGKITVAAGAVLNIAGEVVLHQAIDNSGTVSLEEGASLSFDSVESLSRVDGSTGTTYGDSLAGESGNGYIIGDYVVITGSGDSSSVAKVKINGFEYNTETTEDASKRYVRLGEKGLYYVNTGTLTYGDSGNEAASNSDTTGLVLNGGTLAMSQGLTESAKKHGIRVNGNSNVSLGSSVTLDSSSVTVKNGTTLTLKGSGNYDLGNSFSVADKSVSLGSGVALGDDWTGTVVLSNLTIGGIANNSGAYVTTLNSLGNENSWVKISGVTGYLCGIDNNASPTITANLELVGNAMTLTNGSSNSTSTFSGKIKGDGDIDFAWGAGAGNVTIAFTGDVSGWNGKFKVTSTAAGTQERTVSFSGNATDINADVVNSSAKKTNLNVTNDNAVSFTGNVNKTGTGALSIVTDGSGEKTFSGGINATSLSVNGGSVVLEGTNAIDSVTVANGSSLILGTNTNTLTEVTINSGATLNASAYTTLGGALTMADGSTLTLSSESGLTLNGVLTLGTGLTLNISDIITMASTMTDAGETNYTLATGLTSIGGETSWTGDKDATTYFTTININDNVLTGEALTGAKLTYANNTLSLVTASIPEPTTPALTILALGALALRRRRA